jgi:hypothetical protein
MIEMYATARGFIFRRGTKQVGSMPFDTLQVTLSEEVTEREQWDIDYYSKEYVAGEICKFAGREVILGPLRDFTHEVTLHACGNPDRQQYADIGPRKTVRVCSIEEAQQAVKDYQSRHDMGGGNCAKDHGIVWQLPQGGKGRRKKVGEVCYGGRYDTVAEIKAFKAEMEAKYGKKV